MVFMQKTKINQNSKTIKLTELPWVLLIGPASAGKTALLAHAKIPYILQRHFTPSAPDHFEPSENCDWWITRDVGIIDVPSKYVFENKKAKDSKPGMHLLLWKFFLALIKKQGGAKNISGIAIAVPLAEIMKRNDTKAYYAMIHSLSKRINDLQNTFRKPLPCFLVITKCDLITGFNEYFSEITDEEIGQSWGIPLPWNQKSAKVEQAFVNRFDALIKKLNQQLLWRLHQERNPMARPYIKDFPLQVEKLKGFTLDFIKRLNHGSAHSMLSGVYLTSALQTKAEAQNSVIDEDVNQTERALQLFSEPSARSRAYFTKQFILHSLTPGYDEIKQLTRGRTWKKYGTYAASAATIILASVILGRDFSTGMRQTKKIQHQLADYRNVLQKFYNPNENIIKTLTLLDSLQQSVKSHEQRNIFQAALSYYSDKSQENAAAVYQHALQAYLMPGLRDYFADYLQNPINKDSDSVYSVMTAYLMMGDATHFNSDYVRNVLAGILPTNFANTKQLLHHFDTALLHYQPLKLDQNVINNTRRYLLSLRGEQLSYIILKNIDSNTKKSQALLGDDLQTNATFISSNPSTGIPLMFTGRNFMTVFEQQIQIAATEAATGNWVLGTDYHPSLNPTYAAELAETLRMNYVKNYANAWEAAIANIQLETPRDLEQADAIITTLTSYDSPLLKILNTIHENTYFEPVTTASPQLQNIGQLIDKNNAARNQLYQILASLEALHEYLQPVLGAEDPKKAAYQLMTTRMQHQGELDAITKLRLAADQSPAPLKNWINQLTNDTWRFILKDAMRYLDTSWAEKVSNQFQQQIADRYPFNNEAQNEVSLNKFIHFFGKPGIIIGFYNNVLSPLVDTSKPEWTWKKVDGEDLPLSTTVLHQIQQAMKIHHAFFPNDDDILFVPFALQQQKLDKDIKSITLNINSKIIVDKHTNNANPYVLTWPYKMDEKFSSVELALADKKPIQLEFPGAWGWFKLINQAYESSKSSKEIILNFSKEKYAAQYLLSTQGKNNPFIAMNLDHFSLPKQITTIES